jgi:methyltransferase
MVLSKSLKAWAIASLGYRWTYRVFVLPGAPLVSHGPYAFLRHPNYVAVLGELVSMALLVGARLTGPVSLLFFGFLLRRRIAAEERALGLSHGL